MRKILVSVLFVVAVLAAGSLAGISNQPGPWFDGLVKPSFQPPAWLFAPVWTALYVMIGLAGARTFLAAAKSPAMKLWVAQMLLNLAWSPAFFGVQSPGLALVLVLALLAVLVAFMLASRRRDPVAAGLFLPYAAWTAFASLLNAAIVALN